MASLTIERSQGDVPLPTHFDLTKFTIGAFDNFDHEEATLSGIGGSHDTVSVLFQDMPEVIPLKPNISSTAVEHGSRMFKKELPCQNLIDFVKPAKRGNIPLDYAVS